MSTPDDRLNFFLIHAWDWDLSKISGSLALLIAFLVWANKNSVLKKVFFALGVVLMFLSLTSPLDALSDEYLFSAHMLQHFFLLMLVPPLLIIGLPTDQTEKLLFKVSWVRKIERILSHPIFAWTTANLILWIWHIPFLYDWTLKSESIHIIEHLSFLISATLYWWPILTPIKNARLRFGSSMIYLFLGALSNMLLGILLAFANEPIYQAYLAPEDSWKILHIIQSRFHLTPLSDQRLGGILMWVLGSIVFLVVILVQLNRWYMESESALNGK